MRIVVINLYSNIDELEKIEIEIIEKIKNEYVLTLLHTESIKILEKKFKLIKEKISDLLLKLNLINCKIVIKYFNSGISFFNLTFPKVSYKNMLQNVDSEMEKLIPNYNVFFDGEVVRVKTRKDLKYRVILYPKNNYRKKFQKKNFNLVKIKKIRAVYSYEIIEEISKNFDFEKDINFGFVNMTSDNLIFYILNNGYVIETFDLNIDKSILKKYVCNFEYQKLLKYNDEYFRRICKLISDYMRDRNVFNVLFLFSDDYTNYLKKLIYNNITVKSCNVDYKIYYWKALYRLIYEK